MKYLSYLFLTIFAVFLITGCTERSVNYDKNQPIVGEAETFSFKGVDATKEMLNILEKDLQNNPDSTPPMWTSIGEKTTRINREELLKILKANLSKQQIKQNSNKTSLSASCSVCISSVMFQGLPPGQRIVKFVTETELSFLDNISNSQNMSLYVVDGGYPIFTNQHFYDPGGWTSRLLTTTQYPVYGDSLRAILSSEHQAILLSPNPESYATREG